MKKWWSKRKTSTKALTLLAVVCTVLLCYSCQDGKTGDNGVGADAPAATQSGQVTIAGYTRLEPTSAMCLRDDPDVVLKVRFRSSGAVLGPHEITGNTHVSFTPKGNSFTWKLTGVDPKRVYAEIYVYEDGGERVNVFQLSVLQGGPPREYAGRMAQFKLCAFSAKQ